MSSRKTSTNTSTNTDEIARLTGEFIAAGLQLTAVADRLMAEGVPAMRRMDDLWIKLRDKIAATTGCNEDKVGGSLWDMVPARTRDVIPLLEGAEDRTEYGAA
jgi:hypothetical protein